MKDGEFLPLGLDDQLETTQQDIFPSSIVEYTLGRDELNLAEFPISAIGTRIDPAVKTIVFQDETMDRALGKKVTRKLTITASDHYGLPTSLDDEILLGLLQLSRIQGFTSPTVTFTPHQLLKILGWKVNTPNYQRVRESLDRWKGVELVYVNAWRDKATNKWVDATFSFIDNVYFYHPGADDSTNGNSVFKWNEVVFQSFKDGNLKALDFHLYRKLEGRMAKRLFRFLDKRFYFRTNWSFPLEQFACEKIGLTRPVRVTRAGTETMDVSLLKRRLLPAIEELEKVNFIKPLPVDQRFTKNGMGVWQVHFEKVQKNDSSRNGNQPLTIDIGEISPLEGRLIGHGVADHVSRKLVAEKDATLIENQIDVLEALLFKGKEVADRAAWLVAAITTPYSLPAWFQTREQREAIVAKRAKSAATRELKKAEERAASLSMETAWTQDKIRAEQYLASVDSGMKTRIEEAAIAAHPLGKMKMTALLRESIITNYILDLLDGNVRLD